MAEKVPIFSRRKLFSTTSSQEVGKIRAALTQAGIPFHIGQSDLTPPLGKGGRLALHYEAHLPFYEYTFYVHKDDLEMAQSALDGASLE
ncbi:hypothetical protein [Intestinimonas massiliensis (ex Afouda et al. 2020)]|uniref:hypothetical protein n=1 Tax=Intestinimonas massiliensis (ex Afouda et al. 2020) TaxID=1673721 RepID=UPI001030BAC1|nr:hypothetical protein [Intestinimonas massiliensis (ex Afouda et al. 2020)]